MDTTLALATVVLAIATVYMAWETRKASFRQICIQTWIEFSKRFDSQEMIEARSALAKQLSNPHAKTNEEIAETVLNFFEDLGMLYREGYIERKLTKDTFGFYASRWWKAVKGYVDYERGRHNEDTTLFEDFENLVSEMRVPNERIDNTEIELFLSDEKDLTH